MYCVFWVLGMLAAFLLTAFAYKKIEIFKMAVIGTMVYFCAYVVVSGLFILLDEFSVQRSMIITLAVLALLAMTLAAVNKTVFPRIVFMPKKYLPLAALLIVFAFISGNKAELYSTGQDQGLYEIRAMMYMNNHNENFQKLTEYDAIENPTTRQMYLDTMNDFEGMYITSATAEITGNGIEYEIHGIPTFPALLALWGDVFGLHNMNGILTVFYLAVIAGVWIICDNLKFKRFVSYTIAVMTGICPMILWCSKNLLTEMGLCMMICLFFVFVSEEYRRRVCGWCALPIMAYSFYHITITLTIPLWLVIVVIIYLHTRKKDMVLSFVAILLSYTAGLEMMYKSSPLYLTKNLEPLFWAFRNHIGLNSFHKLVFAICIILSIIAVVLDLMGVGRKLRVVLRKKNYSAAEIKRWKMIFSAIVIVVIAFFIYRGYTTSAKGLEIEKMAVLSFVYMTGFIALPIALFAIIVNAGRFIKDSRRMAMVIALLYAMVVLTGLIWKDINFYYYGARYFAPYMILVLIIAGTVMDFFKPKYVIPLFAIAGGILIYSSRMLYVDKDLTYADFEVVESIASCVTDRDAVIMYGDAMGIHKMLMFPIKATTDADIYFIDQSNYDAQIADLTSRYDNVFWLLYDAGYTDDGTLPWNYTYQGIMHSSIYEKQGEGGLPFPDTAVLYDSSVALLRYTD